MHPEVSKLLKLQSIDGRLEILRRELTLRPEVVEEQDLRVVSLKEKMEKTQADVKQKTMAIDRADLSLKSHEGRIEETRKKLGDAQTNVEFAGFNKQIASIEDEMGEVEDELLALWDDMEGLQNELKSHDNELAEARKVRAIESKEVDKEMESIQAEISQLEAQRGDSLAPIDRELLASYERLYGRYKEYSIVPVKEGICGCSMSMSLSPQILSLLHSDANVVLDRRPRQPGPFHADRATSGA